MSTTLVDVLAYLFVLNLDVVVLASVFLGVRNFTRGRDHERRLRNIELTQDSDALLDRVQAPPTSRSRRPSQGPLQGPLRGGRGPRTTGRPGRYDEPQLRIAPDRSLERSDDQWEYPPDDSLGGPERRRRASLPLTHWMP